MATEHTLKLRAVLDTTDIQSKLSQLKAQQRGGQGGREGLAGGGLQQTLQRLNMTLSSLQRSIERLASSTGQRLTSVPAVQRSAPPIAIGQARAMTVRAAAAPLAQQGGLSTPFGLGNYLRAEQRRLIEGFGLGRGTPARVNMPVALEWRRFQKHGLTGKQLWKNLEKYDDYSSVEAWMEKQGDPASFQTRLNKLRRQQTAGNPIIGRELASRQTARRPMSRQMKANLRMGAGLAFGALAGGVEEYAQATGNQALATGAGAVKNIGYGAAMGMMVGGPIGGLIGGGVGLLNTAFEELARRAREAASALDQQHQRIWKGQDVDNALSNMFRSQRDREAEKKGDRSYFQAQLAQEQALYNKATKSLQKEVGLGGEGLDRFNLREYEKETERQMKLRGRFDPEVQRRQRTALLYTANAKVLQESDARIQDLEKYLEKIGPQGINEARASSAKSLAEQLKKALDAMKTPDLSNVNSLASQGYMISEADDEARLEEANKHLRDIASITRQIRDAKEEAATYGS